MKYEKPSPGDTEIMQLACDRLQHLGVNASIENDRLMVRALGRLAGTPLFTYDATLSINAVELVYLVMQEMFASVPVPRSMAAVSAGR